MRLDDHLCLCFRIPKRKVVNFTRRERPRHASQISECLGAGTGCGWCIPAIVRIHRATLEDSHDEDVLGDAGPDAEDWATERQRYLAEVRAGIRSRNRMGAAPAERPATQAPRPVGAPRPPPDDDDDWDVSDYFSRPPTADPEPDDLRPD